MRNILFIFLLAAFFGCNEDKTVFYASVPMESISFEPVQGGAIMHYSLPDNSDIFAIKVRYTDSQGEKLTVAGTYMSNSLEIVGFNEAQTNVPAYVTLCNNKDEESAPIEVSFSTKDSAPVTFFENVDVSSHWNGFTLIYECPADSKGLAHVFYLGENPVTHKSDTIQLRSFPLKAGKDTLFFSVQQESAFNTIVVRTEDVRGYRVKQKIWPDVEAFYIKKLEPSEFTLTDPTGVSHENEDNRVGIKYLFDNDLKGEGLIREGMQGRFYTFLAGPYATGKPFIIDLKDSKIPASVTIYAALNMSYIPGPYNTIGNEMYESIWNGKYHTKVPSEVSVYASNDKDDDASWVRIGHHYENRSADLTERWAERTANWRLFELTNIDQMKGQEPCFLTVEFAASEERYRYLRFEVNEVFDKAYSYDYDVNPLKYVAIQELEVSVKQE